MTFFYYATHHTTVFLEQASPVKKTSWALVDTKNGNKCFERVRNLPLGMLRVDHIIAVSQCGHRSVSAVDMYTECTVMFSLV